MSLSILESKGSWRGLLFPQRLGALSFTNRVLVLYLVFACGVFIARLLPTNSNWTVTYDFVFVVALLFYALYFAILPRVRDCGLPAWASIALFIPPVTVLAGIGLFLLSSESWPRFRARIGSK